MINRLKNFIFKVIFDIESVKGVLKNEKRIFVSLKKITISMLSNLLKNFFTPIKIRLIKFVSNKKDNKNLMVNIGGGTFFKKHWRVLDHQSIHYRYNRSYIDYDFDLASNKPLPFKDKSVDLFYSSHTLEHIPQEYCQHLFDEIFRCLKKGGGTRLVLPDYDMAYEAYKKKNIAFFKGRTGENLKELFLDFFATYLKKNVSNEDFEKNFERFEKEQFGDYYINLIPKTSQKIYGGNHINWWNFEKAKIMLSTAGFKEIYRSYPQKSRFPQMRGKGKTYGFDITRPESSFFIEVIK